MVGLRISRCVNLDKPSPSPILKFLIFKMGRREAPALQVVVQKGQCKRGIS